MKLRFQNSPVSGIGLILALALIPSAIWAAEEFTVETARAAAEKGDPKAEYFLGKQYLFGTGVPLDYTQAVEYFRQAAVQGDALAENNLGALCARGLGVKQDYEESVKWYRKAAEQGDSLAEYSLGRAYSLGRGIQQNNSEALNWYQKAAQQNQADTLVALGDIYFFGDKDSGVKVDYEMAFQYYTNAVAQGRYQCLNNLGLIYEQGARGVEQNPGLAIKCFRGAAAKREGKAMMNLGRMYEEGMGVEKDSVEAYKWFTLAVRNGAMTARHYQDELNGTTPDVPASAVLTPEQIEEAMRRVNDYTKAIAEERKKSLPSK